MNQNLFFSSVCDVKTAILKQERNSGLQRYLLFLPHQPQKTTGKDTVLKKCVSPTFSNLVLNL